MQRFSFDNENAFTHINDERRLCLTHTSADIAAKFLSMQATKDLIKRIFELSEVDVADNLRKVKVYWAKYVKSAPSEPDFETSWIDKCQPHRIFLNITYARRYDKTNNLGEKNRIAYLCGANIFRQIGELLLLWSPSESFGGKMFITPVNETRTIVLTSERMDEAGTFLEKRFYIHSTPMLTVINRETFKKWSKKSKIIHAAQIVDGKYGLLSQDYIDKVVGGAVGTDPNENPALHTPEFSTMGALPKGCCAFKNAFVGEVSPDCLSTPNAARAIIPTCGTSRTLAFYYFSK